MLGFHMLLDNDSSGAAVALHNLALELIAVASVGGLDQAGT